MRSAVERIQRNGRHLLELINDVLDLSKIEAGQLRLSLADYSVEELVNGVYTSVESLAAEKNLSLRVAVPPGLPPARGDERRLAQALFNLVGNAIKFTDAGEVRIGVEAKGDSYIFSVQDTGPGVDEADQAKIFQEFQHQDEGRRWIGPRHRKAHCGDAWWTNLDRIPPRPWCHAFFFGSDPA
jgi:signal transduction histidine kinase